MNLSELKFSVATKELLDAKQAIDNLSTAMSKLNKATADETKTAIDNEKVKQQQAKTIEANAKAAKAESDAIAAKEKATKVSTESTRSNVSVLERQQSILNFMTQGYSKGQASVLAYAQASGSATNEIRELGSVLEVQRKLMGSSPFDKSMSGLVALKNQYGEVREAIRQYNADSGLTANQTRELARDKERIIEKLKQEGAGLSQIKQAIREYNSAYIDTAAKVNNLSKAEKDRERVMRETANATRNIQAAEERLFATVSHLGDVQSNNVKVNERAALALGSYERNLRLAGISGEEAAKKLAKFKAAQEQVSAAEAKNRASYVARGVGVQLGDVGVSLASGMNPLIVAVQQGDQLRSLLQQSGLEATQMAGIMQQAFKGIITSFKDVGVAMGAFVVGGLQTVGKGFLDTASKMLPFKDTLNILDTKFPDTSKGLRGFIAALDESKLVLGIVGGAIAAVGIALVALLVNVVKVENAISKLNETNLLMGASLGMSTKEISNLAATTANLSTTTNDLRGFYSVLIEGGFKSKDELKGMSEAAIELSHVSALSLEEIAKKYLELEKDPVKALEKLGIETGKVTLEQIEAVKAMQKTGDTAGAMAQALQIAEGTFSAVSQDIRKDLTPWKATLLEITELTNGLVISLQNLGQQQGPSLFGQLLGPLGGLATQGFSKYAVSKQSLEGTDDTAIKKANADAILAQERYTNATKNAADAVKKLKVQEQSRTEYISSNIAKISAEAGRVLNPEHFKAYAKQFGDEWDSAHKKETSAAKSLATKIESYYQQALEKISDLNIKATATTQQNSKAQQAFLDIVANPKWKTLNETQRIAIAQGIENAHTIEMENEQIKQQTEYRKDLLSITEEYKQLAQKDADELEKKKQMLGLTDNEKTMLEAILRVEQARRAELEKIDLLTNKRIADGMSPDVAKAAGETAKVLANQRHDVVLEQTKANTQAFIEQSQSFTTGWNEAFASYTSQAKNAADTGKMLFQRMTDGMTDAIVQFVTTGKVSFKDFANSVIVELIRIQARSMATQLLGNSSSGLFGALLGAIGIGGSKVDTSFTTGMGSASSMNVGNYDWTFSKNGNAFTNSGLVDKFANGGTFTNSVVNKTTPFMFANGGKFGVMGEAGPEAILPLQRTRGGQLGVVASGGASSNVTVNVTVASDGSSKTEVSPTVTGKQFGDAIAAAVQSEIIRQKRNGGLLAA